MTSSSHWLRHAAVAGLTSALLLPFALTLCAEEKSLIAPKWDDPELKAFLQERETTRSINAEPESDRDRVKLPVLELKGSPFGGTRGLVPSEETPPVFLYDENNPLWYQVTQTFGDVTVTIEADRRVLRKLDDKDQVTEANPTRGLAAEGEDVTVYENAAEEEGAPGYVAEYTVEKFGVPYTVRVECTAANKAECADKAKVAETQALLKVTGGSPDAKP